MLEQPPERVTEAFRPGRGHQTADAPRCEEIRQQDQRRQSERPAPRVGRDQTRRNDRPFAEADFQRRRGPVGGKSVAVDEVWPFRSGPHGEIARDLAVTRAHDRQMEGLDPFVAERGQQRCQLNGAPGRPVVRRRPPRKPPAPAPAEKPSISLGPVGGNGGRQRVVHDHKVESASLHLGDDQRDPASPIAVEAHHQSGHAVIVLAAGGGRAGGREDHNQRGTPHGSPPFVQTILSDPTFDSALRVIKAQTVLRTSAY